MSLAGNRADQVQAVRSLAGAASNAEVMVPTPSAPPVLAAVGGAPRSWFDASRAILGVVAGIAMVALVLPHLAGVPWSQVLAGVRGVSLPQLAALAVVWAVGLGLNTFTLTAALPGLTHRRALTLSLTGSAVANVLPLGGAAGVAVNYRMVRAWGFERSDFASYTVVTNVWDVLVKLVVPVVVVPLVLVRHLHVGTHLFGPGLAGSGALGALVIVAVVMIASPRATACVAGTLDILVRRGLRVLGTEARVTPGAGIVRLRASCADLIRSGWPRLTFGVVAYTGTLALLLWGSCAVTGVGLSFPLVLVGFAGERLLSLTGLTPGGAGVVEVGLGALLIALGGGPVPVVTAVLLYRLFTYGIEIPLGGIGLATWVTLRRLAGARGESEAPR